MSGIDRFYWPATVFLFVAALVGGVMLAVRHGADRPVEVLISQSERQQLSGRLYVAGAVAVPGSYHWGGGDTIDALLLDAGITPDADLDRVELYVRRVGETRGVQRIDLNRAEAWLLEALPGIGEKKAEAIVAYRDEDGPFTSIEDLTRVSGIGEATLDKIRAYITVSD